MADDEFEEQEFEEEDFQEAPEPNVLKKKEQPVFCPKCDEYMPYKVKGALVVRKCPNCGFETEG